MPPEIVALIDKRWLLAAVLAIGAVCGIAVERFVENMDKEKRKAYWRGRKQGGGQKAAPFGKNKPALHDATEQLRLVMASDFKPRALLNKGEARVFAELDKLVVARNPGWQVMAQVSVGGSEADR